jgi:rhodanese-related sulfurtransferase
MPQDIDRQRVQSLQARGAAIVEVLPAEEFTHEHLPHAVSLPLEELRAAAAEQRVGSDKQRPIVVYCQSVD